MTHRKVTSAKALWPYGVIAALLACQLAVSLAWLDRVRFPFGSFHLTWSYGYARTLAEEGPGAMLARWAHDDYYPPLDVTVWAVFHRLLGPSRSSIPAATALWYLPGLLAMFALAKRAAGGSVAGLFTCALTLVAPHIAFYFRVPSYEVSMAAMEMVVLWGLVASERFYKLGPLLIAAVAFAAGMLMKWTFVASVAGIAVFALADAVWFGLKRRKIDIGPFFIGRQIFNAAAFAVLAVALAAPWYLFVLSWPKIASNWPTDPTAGGLFTQAFWYLAALYEKILSPPLTVAFAACVPLMFLGKSKRVPAALLASFLGTYAVLSIIPHKELRYGTVLVPYCALVIALGLANLAERFGNRAKVFAVAAGIALLSCGAWNDYSMSFERNVLPLESGDLDEPSVSCANDLDSVMGDLTKFIDQYKDRRIVRLAVHPLSPMSTSFSGDVIAYYLALLSAKEKRHIELIGFGNFQYEDFPARLHEADIMLVPEEVWEMKPADVEKSLRDMAFYVHPGEAPPPVPEKDPLFRERITEAFSEVATIPAKCVKPIHVLKRK